MHTHVHLACHEMEGFAIVDTILRYPHQHRYYSSASASLCIHVCVSTHACTHLSPYLFLGAARINSSADYAFDWHVIRLVLPQHSLKAGPGESKAKTAVSQAKDKEIQRHKDMTERDQMDDERLEAYWCMLPRQMREGTLLSRQVVCMHGNTPSGF